MDQGIVGIVIAALTAVSGYFALMNKEDKETVFRLDQAQTDAISNLTTYADRLEKQMENMLGREADLLKRISFVEQQIMDCHHRSSVLLAENIMLKERLANKG